MIQIMFVLSIIVAAYGIGRYLSFSLAEGQDERGKTIIAKASHLTLSGLCIVYALLLVLITFSGLPADILGLVVTIMISFLFLLHGVSISYLRKQM